MPAKAWPSMPFCLESSMRRDSERISFSIDSIARRGIASVMTWRISFNSLRNAAIDCSMPSGRCSASIWLVILSRYFSSPEKSGAAAACGAIDDAGGAMAGAIGGAAAGRHRPGCEIVKFALARSDFCNRKIERSGIERRRRAVNLRCRALDRLGLALRVLSDCEVLALRLFRRRV